MIYSIKNSKAKQLISLILTFMMLISCFTFVTTPFSASAAVPGAPDLIVTSIGTNPSTAYDLDKVQFYAVVRNMGTANLKETIKLDFSVDGNIIDTVTYSNPIEAGKMAVVTSNAKPSVWFGSHTVRVSVNRALTVNESNFSNNLMASRFKVIDDVNPNPEPTVPVTTIPNLPADKDTNGNPVVTWRLSPQKYDTTDTIVHGLSVADYGATGDGLTDVTAIFQTALNKLGEKDANGVIKGGTLFVPEGKYVIKGNLKIPKGVTLCGDWQEPVKGKPLKGTVLMAYAGRGNETATSFITVQPNAGIRNVHIWYPEQTADNIVAYPPTISLSDPTVWGEDSTFVKNTTFVNSYFALKQGPCACTTLTNIYGSPLKLGMDMDGIHDIARWEYFNFSPDYWAGSGLPNSPSLNGPHKTYIRNNATGISLGRIDWSYLAFVNVEGYKTGLYFRESTNTVGAFPNGQSYDLTFKNCGTGIEIQGGAKEELSEVVIENCDIGVHVTNHPVAGPNEPVELLFASIKANEFAVKYEGYSSLHMQKSIIHSGKVYANNGNLSVIDSDFKTENQHIVMDAGSLQGVFAGNRFNGTPDIIDNGAYHLSVDHTQLDIDYKRSQPDLKPKSYKAARNVLYNVQSAPYNAKGDKMTDDTAAIQQALNKAGADGGGVVYVPPGTYKINGNLTVPSGVELLGSVDISRIPIQLGTIFNVYAGKNNPSAQAAVTLLSSSGIRGIVFNQPEQNYAAPVPYPYVVAGKGSDVYIINVSLRNMYNGVDLFTNKCDNHYVRGLAGFAMKNAIRVGGGSKNGRVYNSQFNVGSIAHGYEEKWGNWENSVVLAERATFLPVFFKNMEQNLDVMIFGDCQDEVIFNNFSIFGSKGLYLKQENGTGPSGWSIGHGADMTRYAVYIEDIGQNNMAFINTQLVTSNQYGFGDSAFITLDSKFTKTANFFNTICWAVPDNNVNVQNGTLNLYNSIFTTMGSDALAKVSANGRFNMSNAFVLNASGTMAKSNQNRISLNYNLLKSAVPSSNLYNQYKNNLVMTSRWAVPTNMTLLSNEKFVFAESFKNYPVALQNGIANAFTGTDSFSEWEQAKASSNVTLVNEGGNDFMRLYCANNAVQSYAYNHSTNFASGSANSQYKLEIRVRIASIRPDAAAGFWGLINNVTAENARSGDGQRLFTFASNGNVNAMGTSFGNWTANKWYRLTAEFDTRNTGNKTVKVSLYNDDYSLIGATGAVNLPANFQNNQNGIGHFILNAFGSSDTGTAGTKNDVYVDYVAVTQKN